MSSKTKTLRHADPHREREAAKYEHPLPSREMILEVLDREGIPLDEDRLASLLGIEAHEGDSFGRRLAVHEGEIFFVYPTLAKLVLHRVDHLLIDAENEKP